MNDTIDKENELLFLIVNFIHTKETLEQCITY